MTVSVSDWIVGCWVVKWASEWSRGTNLACQSLPALDYGRYKCPLVLEGWLFYFNTDVRMKKLSRGRRRGPRVS